VKVSVLFYIFVEVSRHLMYFLTLYCCVLTWTGTSWYIQKAIRWKTRPLSGDNR